MKLRAPNAGFTLVEVLVAVALLATVTAAVALALGVVMQNSEELVVREAAEGLAHDLMDEILNCRYCEPGVSPYAALGPSPSEKATGNRSLFDDIDDYAGLVDEPPHDKWGRLLGKEGDNGQRPSLAMASSLENFRREVKVQYVSSTNFAQPLSGSSVSDYRRIEVTVYWKTRSGQLRPMATVVRVVGHAPTETW